MAEHEQETPEQKQVRYIKIAVDEMTKYLQELLTLRADIEMLAANIQRMQSALIPLLPIDDRIDRMFGH